MKLSELRNISNPNELYALCINDAGETVKYPISNLVDLSASSFLDLSIKMEGDELYLVSNQPLNDTLQLGFARKFRGCSWMSDHYNRKYSWGWRIYVASTDSQRVVRLDHISLKYRNVVNPPAASPQRGLHINSKYYYHVTFHMSDTNVYNIREFVEVFSIDTGVHPDGSGAYLNLRNGSRGDKLEVFKAPIAGKAQKSHACATMHWGLIYDNIIVPFAVSIDITYKSQGKPLDAPRISISARPM